MRISDIIPYERNARRNDKAIPAVAESIREFGFRGQIVLESRDKPVIVCGHTRVAACKSLGWEEIPDENIAFCDGLTEEEIKALRIADNKTGDIAKYNISMLKSEMRSIKSIDMSKFGLDFKSKDRDYGAERLRTDRVYHLDKLSRQDCKDHGYPLLAPEMAQPKQLIGFNYAKTLTPEQKRGNACHFFIDDYQFERVWSYPEKYIDALKGFECVLTPDFSLYLDMPEPMQRWNHYRQQAVGRIWQDAGLSVVPTLTWAQPETFGFVFRGIPRGGTVAVSTVGVKDSAYSLAIWQRGMECALKQVCPERILLYGGRVDFDFGATEVIEYSNSVTDRMAHGR